MKKIFETKYDIVEIKYAQSSQLDFQNYFY